MNQKQVLDKQGNLISDYIFLEQFRSCELQEVGECQQKPKEKCKEYKNNEVKVYSLLELFTIIDFYDMISKHPNLMGYIPMEPGGSYQVEKARTTYFDEKRLNVPSPDSIDYPQFCKENPEINIFDLLKNQGALLRTYTQSTKRSVTEEQFKRRMAEVMVQRYYLTILCCDGHKEDIITQALGSNWIKMEGSKFGDDFESKKKVFPHSLIYVPNTGGRLLVELTKEVSQKIAERAKLVKNMFYEIVTQK